MTATIPGARAAAALAALNDRADAACVDGDTALRDGFYAWAIACYRAAAETRARARRLEGAGR